MYHLNPNRLTDTSPEVEAVLINLLRQAPPWRKLKMLRDLNTTARRLAVSGIRQRYPNATDAEVKRHLADLCLGEQLAATVYGEWDEFKVSA